MNLGELFEMQRKLDEHIVREKGLDGQDLLPKKILALQVELGELANEWQGFKHWKVNPQPKPKMLEEYVDCLHFILSIGLDIGQENISLGFQSFEIINHKQEVIIESFLDVMEVTNLMRFDDNYQALLICFFELGYLLGFTWEQIVQAYKDKNQVNHARQENGY